VHPPQLTHSIDLLGPVPFQQTFNSNFLSI